MKNALQQLNKVFRTLVNKTKCCYLITTLFLFSAPTINAQYQKATRGQVVVFDTAVITEINTFRAETRKFKAADTLIKSFQQEIKLLSAASGLKDSLLWSKDEIIKLNAVAITRKDSAILELSRVNKEFYKQLTSPKKWYERRGVWIAAGALGSFLIVKL